VYWISITHTENHKPLYHAITWSLFLSTSFRTVPLIIVILWCGCTNSCSELQGTGKTVTSASGCCRIWGLDWQLGSQSLASLILFQAYLMTLYRLLKLYSDTQLNFLWPWKFKKQARFVLHCCKSSGETEWGQRVPTFWTHPPEIPHSEECD